MFASCHMENCCSNFKCLLPFSNCILPLITLFPFVFLAIFLCVAVFPLLFRLRFYFDILFVLNETWKIPKVVRMAKNNGKLQFFFEIHFIFCFLFFLLDSVSRKSQRLLYRERKNGSKEKNSSGAYSFSDKQYWFYFFVVAVCIDVCFQSEYQVLKNYAKNLWFVL